MQHHSSSSTIFLSNADHKRYFHGGDADFMDQIHRALLSKGYNCIRLIQEPFDNLAPSDLQGLSDNHFFNIADSIKKEVTYDDMQKKLLNRLQACITNGVSMIVLYIGSRSTFDGNKAFESGSLFDDKFLRMIKEIWKEQIKIRGCTR